MHRAAVLIAVLCWINEEASAHVHPETHARYAHPNRGHPNLFVERGDPYPTEGPEYAVPLLESISATTDAYSEFTLPVKATFTAGSQPSITGAPPLPEGILLSFYPPFTVRVAFINRTHCSPSHPATVNHADYPDPDQIPPTDTAQVQEWMNEIDWSQVPSIPPTRSKDCSDPENAAHFAAAGADGNCWWTCSQCVRDIDITTCANPMDYGHGYDDGPGLYTNKLLTYLESEDLHATFFLVGSRVYYRPEIVQYEYMTGHELSVHTWSHGGATQAGLTQMTNEQVVAELGYTKRIIKEVTGVTPTTMRPPFGDIDDRVRAISLQMGLIPVIWSSKPNPDAGSPNIQWDSQGR